MPFFSIIIPVYNVEHYLGECIESLLEQTFPDWEAVCVDDGSIDNSGKILDQYKERDDRIRVVHQINMGVSAARNRALNLCCGKWVTFLDADDYYSKEWLSVAKSILLKEDPDMLRMLEVDARQNQCKGIYEYDVIEGKADVIRWGWHVFPQYGWSWLTFTRSHLAKSENFPLGVRFSEDTIRNLNILKSLSKVCQAKYRGYYYRKHPDSACGQIFNADERAMFFSGCEKIKPPCGELMGLFYRFLWNNMIICFTNRNIIGDKGLMRTTFCKVADATGFCGLRLKLHWMMVYYTWRYCHVEWPIRLVLRLVKAKNKSQGGDKTR